MNVSKQNLSISRREGTVVLTLDRPERRNALSLSLLEKMEKALDEIAEDRTARVLVIAAIGNVFSAGHDLSEMIGRDESDYEKMFSTCTRVMSRFRELSQPVIAHVQGHALAAGCQLVAACDLAVAAESATFSTPGVKIGLFCTTPMVPLVRTIAPRAALEMLLTGQPISAGRALELGLVNRVAPLDRLDAVVEEWIDALQASSASVLRIGKKAFYDQIHLSESSAYSRDGDHDRERPVRRRARRNEGVSRQEDAEMACRLLRGEATASERKTRRIHRRGRGGRGEEEERI